MTFSKVLFHDLSCGLLRRRYLLIPLIGAVPMADFFWTAKVCGVTGGWMDMTLYLFRGMAPVSLLSGEKLQLPVLWLFVMGGSLLLNLDYLLGDLTLNGQQIIVRCGNRKMWYLSKCLWSMAAAALYYLLLALLTFFLALLSGAPLSVRLNPDAMEAVLEVFVPECFPLFSGIVLPLLTLAALNLLEMTLCLFVKPISGFLICAGALVFSVYGNQPYILGWGAMAVRTLAAQDRQSLLLGIGGPILVMAVCAVLGTIRFSKMDILPGEE